MLPLTPLEAALALLAALHLGLFGGALLGLWLSRRALRGLTMLHRHIGIPARIDLNQHVTVRHDEPPLPGDEWKLRDS